MSSEKLTNLIRKYISNIDIYDPKSGFGIKNKEGKTLHLTKDIRHSFNKVIHVLYVNDKLLKSLLPKDKNRSVTTEDILARYKLIKGGSPRERAISNTEKGYALPFNNFADIRKFLDSFDLKSREFYIHEWFHTHPEELSLLAETGLPVKTISEVSKALAQYREYPESSKQKQLYIKVYNTIDGYDVGHNHLLPYEAITLLAHDEAKMRELIQEFYDELPLGKTAPAVVAQRAMDYINKELEKSIETKFIAIKNIQSAVKGSISVIIESTKGNREGESEAIIYSLLSDAIISSIKNTKGIKGKNAEDIVNQEGSKSFKDYAINSIESALNPKVKLFKSEISKSNKVSPKINVAPTKAKTTSGTVKGPSVRPSQLRNLQGQFTSLTKIENLIKGLLPATVLKNMHRPNLRERTGRFRRSIQLTSLSRGRDGAITAFLSYMKYPYATFERGGAQGLRGYYPSRLLDTSVREIASKLVKERMRVVIN